MQTRRYGSTPAGQPITEYTLQNSRGLTVRCLNYGCRLTHILMPQPGGEPFDVIQGYDQLEGYLQDTASQGAFVGRYAGRIPGATFTIGGETSHLTANNGPNFLHGSFAHSVFRAEILGDAALLLRYTSPAGEDGFPGTLQVEVRYTLSDEDELVLDYRAATSAPTHLNLTNHSYFNLSGEEHIYGHNLWLAATRFLEAREDLCPTGRILGAEGGALDFTAEKPLGRDIHTSDPQLQLAGGYDHCFVLDKMRPSQLSLAAVASDPQSGRTLRVHTTQPAVQLYTGNALGSAAALGKGGKPFVNHGAFCLEAQHYPASPQHAEFPSTLLQNGQHYHEITVYQFETAEPE